MEFFYFEKHYEVSWLIKYAVSFTNQFLSQCAEFLDKAYSDVINCL